MPLATGGEVLTDGQKSDIQHLSYFKATDNPEENNAYTTSYIRTGNCSLALPFINKTNKHTHSTMPVCIIVLQHPVALLLTFDLHQKRNMYRSQCIVQAISKYHHLDVGGFSLKITLT
jgi:hypothetical protein